jgi:lipopolysaccharide transport system permease protein
MTHGTLKETVIEARLPQWYAELLDLPSYRAFLLILLWRDIKVRYKQSVFGIGWAVAQPVIMMVVFTVIFGTVAKIPSNDAPYPIFSYAGLLPWLLFQKALTQGSNSLVSFKSELTKIYFPRIAAPLVAFMSAAVDFVVMFAVLLVMMLYFGVVPTWRIALIPVFVVYAGLAALSIVLWLAAINVEYRDVQHLMPFLAQLWMFITPVVYPSTMIPAEYRLFYWLNPMAAVVEGFRWSILGVAPIPPEAIAISAAVIAISMIGGLRYFNHVAATMADRV